MPEIELESLSQNLIAGSGLADLRFFQPGQDWPFPFVHHKTLVLRLGEHRDLIRCHPPDVSRLITEHRFSPELVANLA
ncbi:hypothetical protein D3C85_1768590 [compost metagenome]